MALADENEQVPDKVEQDIADIVRFQYEGGWTDDDWAGSLRGMYLRGQQDAEDSAKRRGLRGLLLTLRAWCERLLGPTWKSRVVLLVIAWIYCAVMLCGCVPHKPPVVVPPTPTPTPVVTPEPSPTPDWQAFGARRYFFWGGDGARAEQATQVSVWRQEVRPLCGAHAPKCSPMHGDQEARTSSAQDWADVKANMRQWFAARVQDGEQVWVGLDWAGLTFGADGEVVSADLVADTIDVYAEHWDHVAAVWLGGEDGETAAHEDAKARYVLNLMAARGLARKPFTLDVLERELNEQRPQDAKLVDVFMLEAYDAGSGTGSRAEDRRLIQEALSRQLALLPAGARFGIWWAAYDRNGTWAQSKEDLAAVPTHATEWVMADPERRARCVIVAAFCWVRKGDCGGGWCGGGARDYPLTAAQLRRGIAWMETGVDPGPAVPPAETPTPEPTPEPNAPGYLSLDSNGVGAKGNPPVGVLTINATKRGSQAPQATLAYQAGDERCGDCAPEGVVSGVLTFGPGNSSRSITVPISPRAQAHCELPINLGPATGGVNSVDKVGVVSWSPRGPGVGWFRCSFSGAPGEPAGTVESYGLSDRPLSVCYTAQDAAGKVLERKCGDRAAGVSLTRLGVTIPRGSGVVMRLCLTSARTTDTGTPQPIVGPACVDVVAR